MVRLLTGSTTSSNTATADGGGINGFPILINTTVSDNRANGSGGGLYHNGGDALNLYNVTVAGDTARAHGTGSGLGGGIYNGNGAVYLQNSIVGNNI